MKLAKEGSIIISFNDKKKSITLDANDSKGNPLLYIQSIEILLRITLKLIRLIIEDKK